MKMNTYTSELKQDIEQRTMLFATLVLAGQTVLLEQHSITIRDPEAQRQVEVTPLAKMPDETPKCQVKLSKLGDHGYSMCRIAPDTEAARIVIRLLNPMGA